MSSLFEKIISVLAGQPLNKTAPKNYNLNKKSQTAFSSIDNKQAYKVSPFLSTTVKPNTPTITTQPIPDKPKEYIYHTTHINNMQSIMREGIKSHTDAQCQYDISNHSFNSRRSRLDPFYNRRIHDYVPFYFNPRNAFMYSSHAKGRDNHLVIIAIDTSQILRQSTLVTNGNAALDDTEFCVGYKGVLGLPDDVFSDRWVTSKGKDFELCSRMMSEVLISETVQSNRFVKLIVKNRISANMLKDKLHDFDVKIVIQPEKFFE